MSRSLLGVLLTLLGCLVAVPAPRDAAGQAGGERGPASTLRQIIPGHYVYHSTNWLRALDTIEALDADIFVPGHGPIPADPRQRNRESMIRSRANHPR